MKYTQLGLPVSWSGNSEETLQVRESWILGLTIRRIHNAGIPVLAHLIYFSNDSTIDICYTLRSRLVVKDTLQLMFLLRLVFMLDLL